MLRIFTAGLLFALWSGVAHAQPSQVIEKAVKDCPPGATDLVPDAFPRSGYPLSGELVTRTETARVTEIDQLAFTGRAVLLAGKVTKKEGSKSIASGLASATIMKERSEETPNGGQKNATRTEEILEEMRIRASEIVFDSKMNSLECAGSVEIVTNGKTIKGSAIRVELGTGQAACVLIDQAKAIDRSNKPPPAMPGEASPPTTEPATQEHPDGVGPLVH
jgi:hypothetical protein